MDESTTGLAGHLARVHHHAAHAHHTLRHKFLEVATLPVSLRRLIGLGAGGTLAGFLLLAARDLPGPPVIAAIYKGTFVASTPLLLAAIAVIMALAWTYILAGCIAGHPAVRLTGLVLFGYAILPIATAGGWRSGGVIAAAAAVALVLGRGRGRASAAHGRDVAVLGGLVGAVHFLAVVDGLRGGAAVPYAFRLIDHVVRCVFFPFPILIIAGLDLAELTVMVSGWMVVGVRRLATTYGLAALALAAAAVKLAWGVHSGAVPSAAWGPTAIMVVYLVLLWRLDPRGAIPSSPPYWLLLAFALSYLAGPLLGSLSLAVVRSRLPGGAEHLSEFGWLATSVVWVAATAFVFVRGERGGHRPVRWLLATLALWLLLTLAPDGVNAVFGGLRLSTITLPALDMQISAIVLAVTMYLMMTRRGHAHAYATALTVLAVLALLRGVHALLGQDVEVGDLLNLAQLALLLVTAVAVARLEGEARPPWPVLAAGLGVTGLLAYLLVTAREPAQRIYLIQVCVLILSVGWDLLVSGERFANGHSRFMPRATRLFLYLGAMLITAATMLWFNTARGLDPGLYRPGVFPRLGLVMLGTPLLLLSLLRMVRGDEAAPNG